MKSTYFFALLLPLWASLGHAVDWKMKIATSNRCKKSARHFIQEKELSPQVENFVPNHMDLYRGLEEDLYQIENPIFRIVKILEMIKNIPKSRSLEYQNYYQLVEDILAESFLLKNSWKFSTDSYNFFTSEQIASFMKWIDFLDSPEMYDQPAWIKYWIIKGVLSSGNVINDYDSGIIRINKRSKNQTGPYPSVEKFALKELLSSISTIKSEVRSRKFRKVYSHYISKYINLIERSENPADLFVDFLEKGQYLAVEKMLARGLDHARLKMKNLSYSEKMKLLHIWAAIENGKIIQTPIEHLKKISDYMNFRPGETLIDIGSGHGDPALIFGALNPKMNIIGYELVSQKVDGSKINLDYLGLSNVNFIQQDLSVSHFVLPRADYYYMFNPVNADVLEFLLRQIKTKKNPQSIKILVYGKGRTLGILNEQGFKLIDSNEDASFSIYSLPRD